MTVAEQVEEVMVRGWDGRKKSVIIGRADKGELYPRFTRGEGTTGDEAATDFGKSKAIFVDQAVASQREADLLAMARLNEISGAFLEAEGRAFRRPEIKAGQLVQLDALGDRFSAIYLVTSATHSYTSSGFTTAFTVHGARTGLLTDQLRGHKRITRQSGPAPAIVTNTDDPDNWGRNKVKYPWMSDNEESDWIRVASAGAGATAGFCLTPAVDDEVLVAFVHGDFNQPVVLGGLWNGVDPIPEAPSGAATGEKPLIRSWQSRTGHQVVMYDNAENCIKIRTQAGHEVTLNDAKKRITITTTGGLELILDDDGQAILVKSTGKVTLQASSELAIEANGNLTLSAGGNFQLQARGNVQIQATGRASVGSAAMVSLAAPQISLG